MSQISQALSLSLAEQRLQVFNNLKNPVKESGGVESCNLFRPSSQDALAVAFKYNSSNLAFVLIRQQVLLLETKNQQTNILGVAQITGYQKPKNLLGDIFSGKYRNVCGHFYIPLGIFYKPLTYYSIDPRQGEVIIGELDKLGKITRKDYLHYEYGGADLKFKTLKTEHN